MPSFRSPPGVCAGLVVLLLLAGAGHAAADEDWKFDVVHLKNGRSLQGLLVEESAAEIQFRCVSRKPGSHTVVIPTTFDRAEVDHLDLLDDRDRADLVARLKALDPTGKGEAQRMASLVLKPAPWGKDGKGRALEYDSTHFILISNAAEDVVRRAAVRLEQIFAAYARFLPPRAAGGQPTTILLARSLADYKALLHSQSLLLLNPALYDTRRNEILCGSDLQRLGDQLEEARQQNGRLLAELKEKEAQLNKLFKNEVPPALLRPIQEARQNVERQNRRNDEQFHEATRQLFRALYHEAFHAYLANFVYPPVEADVPRWLNEGLAQVFESAFVEAGELRIGHADKVRLARAQADLARGRLVPLVELLRSGPQQFVVRHASDQQTSDRYYLTSWAVAFYLTFGRRLLGTTAMHDYVRALHRGADSVSAFRDLVGEAPEQFDKEFRRYLDQLRPNGTVATRAAPGK
jgi:hypothetical protein